MLLACYSSKDNVKLLMTNSIVSSPVYYLKESFGVHPVRSREFPEFLSGAEGASVRSSSVQEEHIWRCLPFPANHTPVSLLWELLFSHKLRRWK